MKVCTKCRTAKDESEFSKNKYKKDGLQHWCKNCYKTNFMQTKEEESMDIERFYTREQLADYSNIKEHFFTDQFKMGKEVATPFYRIKKEIQRYMDITTRARKPNIEGLMKILELEKKPVKIPLRDPNKELVNTEKLYTVDDLARKFKKLDHYMMNEVLRDEPLKYQSKTNKFTNRTANTYDSQQIIDCLNKYLENHRTKYKDIFNEIIETLKQEITPLPKIEKQKITPLPKIEKQKIVTSEVAQSNFDELVSEMKGFKRLQYSNNELIQELIDLQRINNEILIKLLGEWTK